MRVYIIIETDQWQTKQSAVILGLSATLTRAKEIHKAGLDSKSDDTIVSIWEAELDRYYETGLLNNAVKIL